MKTKSAQRVLFSLLALTSISSASLASRTYVDFDVDANSATGRAFQTNPNQAINTMEAALRQQAYLAENPSIVRVTMDLKDTSPAAQAYNQDPAKFSTEVQLHFISKALEIKDTTHEYLRVRVAKDSKLAALLKSRTKEDLAAAEGLISQDNPKHELEVRVKGGDLTAFNLLVDASRSQDALKWLFVEMLMTFGESYQFERMCDLSKYLMPGQIDSALESAAEWVQNNLYHEADAEELSKNPRNISEAFETYFAQGKTEEFFLAMDKLENLPRMSYMNFFSHLGIRNVNLESAKKLLSEANKNKLKAAQELCLVLECIYNPRNTKSNENFIKATEQSRRPIIQYIHAILKGENATPPHYKNLKETTEELKWTLKIK